MLPLMPIPHARRMNQIALALLITALISFVAVHFLVLQRYTDPMLELPETVGWQVWPGMGDTLRFHLSSNDISGMVALSAFITFSLTVIGCPLLVPFLRASRISWWIVVITSGAAMCGLGGNILMEQDPSFSTPGPGLYCLLASLALNFLGLLFIRREVPAAPEVDPA